MQRNEFLKSWCIGLTGGIASGKSTVAQILENDFEDCVVDADKLSHELILPETEVYKKILGRWGEKILSKNGPHIDRSALGALVFESKEDLLFLEHHIHKGLEDMLFHKLDAAGILSKPRFFFYEATLLFEKKRASSFYKIWLCYAPIDLRLKRACARDQRTIENVQAIMKAQGDPEVFRHQASCLIETAGTYQELRKRVESCRSKLKGK